MAIKIGVMGAGAVGCYAGGRLAAAGQDVVMIGRERTRQEIAAHGLVVVGLDGDRVAVPSSRFVLSSDVAALADRDVVLCCVKSGATAEAGRLLAGALAPDALVISLQNGMRNARELRACLQQAVLAGIVSFNVLSGAGVYRRATSGPLIIEDRADSRLDEFVAASIAARLPTERSADIAPLQWSKLVINLNNSVSALSGAPTAEILLSSGYRAILAAVMGEALAVLRAAGVRPARLGPLPVRAFPWLLGLPTPIVRLFARAQARIDPDARSSMWEDLERRRPTEVEYLNGEVVRLAATCGASAPLNARLVELVHAAERAGAGSPQLSADALASALHAG